MPSLVSLLPVILAASGAFAIPQGPVSTNAAAISAGYVQASAASAQAAQAAAAYSGSAVVSGDPAAVSGGSAPQITGPDQCGPKVPDPRVPDSCDSYVDVSTGGAMPYNASCLNDGSGYTLNLDSCNELIQIMCSNEFQHAGEWVFASNDQCSLGSYLPLQSNTDGTPTGAAQWPGQANCEVLIYGAMLEDCTGTGSNQYNTISVNLPVLPNNTPSGTGQQVNVGYGSYVISPWQLRNVSDTNSGSGTANDLPAVSIEAAASANFVQAVVSESKILATMTGSAAVQAQSDLAAYAADVLSPSGT